MKILYVIHDNKKGGAAISFLNMIKSIKEKHEVFVLVPHKTGYIPDELNKLNISYMNAHYYWWMISCPSNFFLRWLKILLYRVLQTMNRIEAYRVGAKLAKQEFDIIHTNSSVINFGGHLSKVTGIPHVWHIREYGQEDFDLRAVYSEKNIYDFMDANCRCFIAISKDIQRKYSKLVNEDKIVQVYNGIEKSMDYKKNEFPQSGDKIKFLIAGNYCREKGQIDVARAADWLLCNGENNFEVYMAGNGDFKAIQEIIDKKNLTSHIKLLGKVDDMISLRKKVDVEIVASKCEAFGRVTVEAMRMSNPVIGTNSGGTLELIDNGVTGLLFNYMDYKELARLMKCLIDNPSELARMGRNAFDFSIKRFTVDEYVEKILEIYNEQLDR